MFPMNRKDCRLYRFWCRLSFVRLNYNLGWISIQILARVRARVRHWIVIQSNKIHAQSKSVPKLAIFLWITASSSLASWNM